MDKLKRYMKVMHKLKDLHDEGVLSEEEVVKIARYVRKVIYQLEEMAGGCVNVRLSLKELGLICLGLEVVSSWDVSYGVSERDFEVCEALNERLVDILEREDG